MPLNMAVLLLVLHHASHDTNDVSILLVCRCLGLMLLRLLLMVQLLLL